MKSFDPRVHAIRADLADIKLKGKVDVPRFAQGEPMRVIAPQAQVRRAPSDRAPLDTEALRGERVMVFDTAPDGWCWAQLAEDRYVGWMAREALGDAGPEPTHRISALRTFVFSEPDIKSPPLQGLSLGAGVSVVGEAADKNACYAIIAPVGAIVTQHLRPIGDTEPDWTAIAERFFGVPYLWGGKTSLGIDCSGLVQVALAAAGIRAPRDSDMQAEAIGRPLPLRDDLSGLERGDLVFWPGHVGIMRDRETMVHATAHAMSVISEPLRTAIERHSKKGLELGAIRRVAVV